MHWPGRSFQLRALLSIRDFPHNHVGVCAALPLGLNCQPLRVGDATVLLPHAHSVPAFNAFAGHCFFTTPIPNGTSTTVSLLPCSTLPLPSLWYRPLVLGRRDSPQGEEYCIASEDCAFGPIGFTRVRDVQPGEMVIVSEDGKLHTRQVCPSGVGRGEGYVRMRACTCNCEQALSHNHAHSRLIWHM